MTVEQIAGGLIALVVMFIGLVGTVIPGIPGSPIILVAAIGHRMYYGEQSASYTALVLIAILMLLSMALDFFASMFGAKKLGATWKGILGAVIGGIVGLFFSLPGIILGPFVGAFLFEMAGGREAGVSAKAGAGAMLGLLLGAVGKIACCVAMICIFVVSAYWNIAPGVSQPESAVAMNIPGAIIAKFP
ncbi:MAG: DUF456 domain-containing protein [Verrucomicrobiales bacterium]